MALLVEAATDCSPRTDNEIVFVRSPGLQAVMTLDELVDQAELVVRGAPISREQVNIPITRSGGTGTEPPCEWKVMVEFEVSEFLKGVGDEVIRVVISVAEGPSIQKPLAQTLSGRDLEVGQEYVLLLGSPRLYLTTPGLAGRNYQYVGGRRGLWQLDDGFVLAPPGAEFRSMPVEEFRVIVAEAANSP